MSDIITTYHGVEITYDEHGNKWIFEKGGKERSSATLATAKEAIDKPEPKENNFKRTQVWYKSGYDPEKLVDVTAMCETKSYDGSPEFWIMDGKRRSKQGGRNLYSVTPENNAIFTEITKLKEAEDSIRKRIAAEEKKLKNFKPE